MALFRRINTLPIIFRSFKLNTNILSASAFQHHKINRLLTTKSSSKRPLNSLKYSQIRVFCNESPKKCWSCGTELTGKLFCSSCKSLQAVDNQLTFFDIFDLPSGFTLNTTDLSKQFRQLQSVLHPDKFSQKSGTEQHNSDDWSALVNKAYKTLAVPITRAEYLLEQEGIAIPEDNSALDAEFLMEMMERNEAIEEANDRDDLKELLDKVQENLGDLVKFLDAAFSSKNSDDAIKILIRMRYEYSIENSIKEKVQRLGLSLE